MKQVLLWIICILLLSGCSKFTMGYKESRVDYSMLQNIDNKYNEKIVLLSDNEILQIPCTGKVGCTKMQDFFEIGDITNKLAQLYFQQFYSNVQTMDHTAFPMSVDIENAIIIYPKVLDYNYSFSLDMLIRKTILLNLKMNIQVYSGHAIIFEKQYAIEGLKSETTISQFNELTRLQNVLYKAIFEIFGMSKKDIDEVLSKDSHENIN